MRITKIIIKNLFGIKEQELDGRSIEIKGANGTGKTSVLDAIRMALTNSSDRRIIVKNGESEGEIILETDSGLSVDRKKRSNGTEYKSVRNEGKPVGSPEQFLRGIFTPLQLDPSKFVMMPENEQNRSILDMVEFEWDKDWLEKQFGEIPPGVDLNQHILKVLEDIQSENGAYYRKRQDLGREIKVKRANNLELSKAIPQNYMADKWRAYDFKASYSELARRKSVNESIAKAVADRDSYNGRIAALEGKRDSDIAFDLQMAETEKQTLASRIAQLEKELALTRQKLDTAGDGLEVKKQLHMQEFEASKAKVDASYAEASKLADAKPEPVAKLEDEVTTANDMIRYLNEYDRMKSAEDEIGRMESEVASLTDKIETARRLPAEILKKSELPIEGLTVSDGVPMIDRGSGPLPLSNLSEGEKLDLCIDIAVAKPTGLQMILIDGLERLSEENRERIYARCRDKGLMCIATRTTDDSEMEIVYL